LKMNFNFNMDRIRGEGGRGQRTGSPVVVICITRGIGGLNGDSPTESVGSLCLGHSSYLSVIAWQQQLTPRSHPGLLAHGAEQHFDRGWFKISPQDYLRRAYAHSSPQSNRRMCIVLRGAVLIAH